MDGPFVTAFSPVVRGDPALMQIIGPSLRVTLVVADFSREPKAPTFLAGDLIC